MHSFYVLQANGYQVDATDFTRYQVLSEHMVGIFGQINVGEYPLAVYNYQYDFAKLLSFVYEYDGKGNPIKKEEKQWLEDDHQTFVASYQYGVRGQLLEERRLDGIKDTTTRYRYDAVGKRVYKECLYGDVAYGYNEKTSSFARKA